MKFKDYFTTLHITKGLAIAICLSSFIYLEHFFHLNRYLLMFIDTILGLFGFYFLITQNRAVWFFSGFFIGIFWLWWLGVSFKYYNMPYLEPVAIFAIGLFWGIVFAILEKIASFFANFIEKKTKVIKYDLTIELFRGLALLILPFIAPFGFDWLKPQLIFIDSIFGVKYWQYALIILTLAVIANTKRYLFLILLIFAIDFKKPFVYPPSYLKDIELVSTNESVKEKWKVQNQIKYTNMVLNKIDKAIKKGKKLIILPESVLPYFLNLSPTINALKSRSKDATIVVGALYYKSKDNYRNSAFVFKNGNYIVANKVVLVPFGEANPLPNFMSKIVNKIFFDGAVDYKADSNYTYIDALDKKYKIAICYEGTHPKTFEDKPKYLIVISNDGWFVPSIEPTLQKLLLKYYAKLYKTTIYHSINDAKSYIVAPHPEDLDE